MILLACVLTLSGETWAAPPADPVRDAKSGTATGASVKGMKLKVSTNGRYFGPFKLDPYDHHAALLGA